MDFEKNVGGRSRLVRALFAVVLAIVAVRALRSGKRKTGLLAGIGALGVGVTATTQYCGVNDTLDRDTTGGEVTTTGQTSDTTSTNGITSEQQDEPRATSTSQKSRPRGSLTCAACGEPIRVGQRRGPNDRDQIVHDGCL